MDTPDGYTIRRLGCDDIALMEALSTLFGEAFDEVDTYTGARPSASYLERLLGGEAFLAVVALRGDDESGGGGDEVVGGLAAYELQKFEQERSEVYIYDLAVAAAHRRRGVATALLREVTRIAVARGAHAVFVQADYGDAPAVALYTKLGRREDVLHFDLELDPTGA